MEVNTTNGQTLVAPGAAYASIGIIGATVMPHALFLGSSLAGIDRLNMLPRPPIHRSDRPKAYLMRKIKSRFSKGKVQEQAEIELQPVPTLTGLAGPSVRLPVDMPNAYACEEGKDIPSVPRSDADDQYAQEMERFQAEMGRFDRVKWVTLHLWHASVSHLNGRRTGNARSSSS
jgi:metal iron transporter